MIGYKSRDAKKTLYVDDLHKARIGPDAAKTFKFTKKTYPLTALCSMIMQAVKLAQDLQKMNSLKDMTFAPMT